MSDEKHDPPVDREAVTPRQSGTLARWQHFADLAGGMAANCFKGAVQAERGPSRDRIKGAALRLIATEATRLREAFEHWQFGDPGADLRRGALHRLMVLRDQAKELGIDVDRF